MWQLLRLRGWDIFWKWIFRGMDRLEGRRMGRHLACSRNTKGWGQCWEREVCQKQVARSVRNKWSYHTAFQGLWKDLEHLLEKGSWGYWYEKAHVVSNIYKKEKHSGEMKQEMQTTREWTCFKKSSNRAMELTSYHYPYSLKGTWLKLLLIPCPRVKINSS